MVIRSGRVGETMMKKKIAGVCIIICLLTFLAACGSAPLETQESHHGDMMPYETSSENETEMDDSIPVQVESLTESTESKEKENYSYLIKELDLSLLIPGELSVVETENILRDWNDDTFRFTESKLILITQKTYEAGFWEAATVETLKEEAEQIVFAFAITPREYYPIYRMCYKPLEGGKERATEDYYVDLVYPYTTSLEENSLKWWNQIKSKTGSVRSMEEPTTSLLMLNVLEIDGGLTDYTVLNPEWWEVYQDAVAALSTGTEQYAYKDTEILKNVSFVLDMYENNCTNRNNFVFRHGDYGAIEELDYLTNVYVDQELDIYLRAYHYASDVIRARILQLELPELAEYMIVFQNWSQSQRSYTVFYPSGGFGSDSDYMVDLSAVYERLLDK